MPNTEARTDCTEFLPGDTYRDLRVVASVIYSEDRDGTPTGWTLLLINDAAPYFTVVIVERNNRSEWSATYGKSFENIVPAVQEYEQCGGDY